MAIKSSLPFPNIVMFAPESSRPLMVWPFIITDKCGRRSSFGTVMSAANSIISISGASSSDNGLTVDWNFYGAF